MMTSVLSAQTGLRVGDMKKTVADEGQLISPLKVIADGIDFGNKDISGENDYAAEMPYDERTGYGGFADSASLVLPPLTQRGTMPSSRWSYLPMSAMWGWNGWNTWDLHPGLNVSLGASVFASFGKGSTRAGFAQNLSVMYAMQLSKNMSLAVGGYFDNINYGSRSYQNGGLSAVLGYQFSDKWFGYIYAQKSIISPDMSPWMYDMTGTGDRIGAAVRYQPNRNFSIQLNVEADHYPNSDRRNRLGYNPMGSDIPTDIR